ncbi:MAG TPA: O-antigen ligase family protein [Anaerolineales bacterium]|nr:O-antigen ligase family protein [Anaerolineales bacterium]
MRDRPSAILSRFARLAFGSTIVLAPLRWRLTLAARPFPPVYRDYSDFLLYASDLSMGATLIFWAGQLGLERRRPKAGPWYLALPVAGLPALGLVTAIGSVDAPLSLYHVLRLVLLGGLYLYVRNEVRSPSQLALPVAGLLLTQSAVGVSQFLAQRSLGLERLGELTLDPAWRGVSVVSAGGERILRAYGLADHPNILGGCLALSLILLAAWHGEAERPWQAPLAGGLTGLGALALLLTFSRAAWLALAVGVVFAVALLSLVRPARPLRRWLSLLAAGLVVLLPFAWQNAEAIGVRLNQEGSFRQVAAERRSLDERAALIAAANQIFASDPLTGVGLGAFPTAMRQAVPIYPRDYQPPHIVLLEAGAELGVAGALLFLLASLGPWFGLWSVRRRGWSPALIGASALLLALSVVGLFDYYPWLLPPGRIFQWLSWGLWASWFESPAAGALHA